MNRHAVCPRSVALRTSKNKRGISCPDSGAVSPGRLLGWRCEGPLGIPAPPPSGPQFAEVGELFPGKGHASQDPWLCPGSQMGVLQPGQHLHRHISSVISRHRPSFKCARDLQRCWQTFKVLLDSPSCRLHPGSSPAGETGSRAWRPAAAGAQHGRGLGAGLGDTSSRWAWDGGPSCGPSGA